MAKHDPNPQGFVGPVDCGGFPVAGRKPSVHDLTPLDLVILCAAAEGWCNPDGIPGPVPSHVGHFDPDVVAGALHRVRKTLPKALTSRANRNSDA